MKKLLLCATAFLGGVSSAFSNLNINFSGLTENYTPILFSSTVPADTAVPTGLNEGATFLFESVGTFNSQPLDAVIRFDSFYNSEGGISLGPIGDFDAGQSLGFDLRGRASQDQHVKFSLRFVNAGSATNSNPLGTIANITETIIIQSFDIDSNSKQDFTDIFGFNSATSSPDFIGLSSETQLESGSFETLDGQTATSGYTTYRRQQVDGSWRKLDNSKFSDLSTQEDITLSLVYSSLDSPIDLIWGATGSHNDENSRGLRINATDPSFVPNIPIPEPSNAVLITGILASVLVSLRRRSA